MYTTSKEYSEAVAESGRNFTAKIYDQLNHEIQAEIRRMQILKRSGNGKDITIGGAYSSYFEIESVYDGSLLNVEISVKTGLNGEFIPEGRFTVNEEIRNDGSTTIKGYDCMSAKGGLLFAPTKTKFKALCSELATQFGTTFDTACISSVTDFNLDLSETNYSLQTAAGILAGLVGMNAFIDRNGKLTFRAYTASSFVFSDDNCASINLGDTSKTITGIDCKIGDDTGLISGTGTMLQMVNPFMTQALLDSAKSKVNGLTYRQAEINLLLGDPRIDPWDIAKTSDNENIILSEIDYSYDGGIMQNITCDCSAVSDESASNTGQLEKELEEVKKRKALYQTEDSTGTYWHDKQTLSESSLILKINDDGIKVSKDGGINWYGLEFNGDFFARYINADYITALRLQVGDTTNLIQANKNDSEHTEKRIFGYSGWVANGEYITKNNINAYGLVLTDAIENFFNEGDTIYYRFTAKTETEGKFRIEARFGDDLATSAGTEYITSVRYDLDTNEETYEGVLTVTSECADKKYCVLMLTDDSATKTQIYISDARATKQIGSVSIENGAITADKIKAGAIIADMIQSGVFRVGGNGRSIIEIYGTVVDKEGVVVGERKDITIDKYGITFWEIPTGVVKYDRLTGNNIKKAAYFSYNWKNGKIIETESEASVSALDYSSFTHDSGLSADATVTDKAYINDAFLSVAHARFLYGNQIYSKNIQTEQITSEIELPNGAVTETEFVEVFDVGINNMKYINIRFKVTGSLAASTQHNIAKTNIIPSANFVTLSAFCSNSNAVCAMMNSVGTITVKLGTAINGTVESPRYIMVTGYIHASN